MSVLRCKQQLTKKKKKHKTPKFYDMDYGF